MIPGFIAIRKECEIRQYVLFAKSRFRQLSPTFVHKSTVLHEVNARELNLISVEITQWCVCVCVRDPYLFVMRDMPVWHSTLVTAQRYIHKKYWELEI